MVIDDVETAASFFPTANEVVRAVQFVRENPAVVLGVVVGITSLSVARYYEDEEEHEGEYEAVALSEGTDENDTPNETVTVPSRVDPPRKLTRSSRSSTLLLNGDASSMAETTSSSTIESSELATTPSDHQHKEDQAVDAICDKMSKSCSFCNQAKESPDACCDPDWGWFIPTSPDDEHNHHHGHEHHHHGAVQGA